MTEKLKPVKSTGRGGKNNFPAAQIPDTDPGDNAKYLTMARAVMDMPPIDKSDINQVKRRINEYMDLCTQFDMKPTVKGFCNSLGITRQTLLTWKNGEYRANSHQAIIVKAYNVLEELWEDYMLNGKINPVSGIFLGKNNFSYVDKQDVVLTPNTGAETVDVAIIEAKYAELPEA